MRDKLKVYYQLTKPGVLFGNVLTAGAGYFLAARGNVDWLVFAAMLVGTTLVIAAACVLNNYLDQDIDALMERTKKRPSVRHAVSGTTMVAYSVLLLVLGMAMLYLWTNALVVWIGAIGFVTYVWLYGALSKRMSVHGTLVGSISGAMPIAGGYAAASGVVDAGLVISFLILFFWQFPEFYSISIYRREEYAKAGIPLMSVVYGVKSTIRQIYVYTLLYILSTLALTLYGYTGWVFAGIMLVVGLVWMRLASEGFTTTEPEKWARKMFRFAMYHLLLVSVLMTVSYLLP